MPRSPAEGTRLQCTSAESSGNRPPTRAGRAALGWLPCAAVASSSSARLCCIPAPRTPPPRTRVLVGRYDRAWTPRRGRISWRPEARLCRRRREGGATPQGRSSHFRAPQAPMWRTRPASQQAVRWRRRPAARFPSRSGRPRPRRSGTVATCSRRTSARKRATPGGSSSRICRRHRSVAGEGPQAWVSARTTARRVRRALDRAHRQ